MKDLQVRIKPIKGLLNQALNEISIPDLSTDPNVALERMTAANQLLVTALKALVSVSRTIRPDANLTDLNDCPLLREARDSGMTTRSYNILAALVRHRSDLRQVVDLSKVSRLTLMMNGLGGGEKYVEEVAQLAARQGVGLADDATGG